MEKFVRITTERLVKSHEVKHKAQSNIFTQSSFRKNTDGLTENTIRNQLLQA